MNNIEEKVNLISESLEWIKRNRPEQYESRFEQLVPLRSTLRTIIEANDNNPAIAAYGQSQMGKSYLIGNLLQKKVEENGKIKQSTFMIKVDNASKIEEYDFVHCINPQGNNCEATGVVTRFTSYKNHPDRYSAQYPARMKVLSVANIATILIDGYFKDVINYESYSDDEIKQKTEAIFKKYSCGEDIQNDFIEDDIFDIKLYLQKFVNCSQNICNSGYFEKIALIIRKVPQNEWLNILSVLWHDSNDFNALFSELVNCLARMHFARYVYLPIDAVLHNGNNSETVMSVDCLNDLYNGGAVPITKVYAFDTRGKYECLGTFRKCEVSALCREITFKVDEDYLDTEAHFYYEEEKNGQPGYMSERTFNKLDPLVSKKELFDNSDLLDFPGAKNRESLKLEDLGKIDRDTLQPNMVKVYLRGKVAYLFNHYSDAKLINILMICHHGGDVGVTSMYNNINEWVSKYVGIDETERKKTVTAAGGIAPLFVIGTKFNMDMTCTGHSDSPASLHQRWYNRFIKVLYRDLLHASNVDWFNNWTGKGVKFNNTFVLRDFKFSACNGEGNNLFSGFDTCSKETKMELTPEFYTSIRNSFINDDFDDKKTTSKFFDDPETSWEVAATINNDGALYIIQQLVKVSKNLNGVREKQLYDDVMDNMSKAKALMEDYYINPDMSDALPRQISKAKKVFREFDFACNKDNYFFGHFIDLLQLKYKEAYDFVHDLIQDPNLIGNTMNWQTYELIRQHIADCKTEEESWAALINTYGFDSKEKAEEYIRQNGINPEDIIPGTCAKPKTISYAISDRLFNYWVTKFKAPGFLNHLISECEFDSNVMADFLINLNVVAESLNLVEHMADSISQYVNIAALNKANEYLVSDTLVTFINSFVNTLGFDYRTQDDTENCKHIANEYQLPVFKHIGVERKTSYTEQELTDLFREASTGQSIAGTAFHLNYSLWLEYMFVSYIGGSAKVPEIKNIEENNKVAELIKGMLTC